MKVACPKCGVSIILVILEFQNGELMPCRFKCPHCTTRLEYHKDFSIHDTPPEPKLLVDACCAELEVESQTDS
jgi:hypothetical protein